jgi:hypothetical protein
VTGPWSGLDGLHGDADRRPWRPANRRRRVRLLGTPSSAARAALPCLDRPPPSAYLIHPCVDHESITIGEDTPSQP